MRLAMTPAFFHPHVGGIETHSYNLAREFVKRGHDVHILTSRCPGEAPRSEEFEGIQIHRLSPSLTIYNAPILLGLPGVLGNLEVDLVHTHLPSPYLASASATLARMKGLPTVLTYHNDIVAQGRFYSAIAGAYNASLGRALLEMVDRIICTSIGYATSSPYLGPHLHKVVPIQNGVDTEFFHPGADGSTVNARFGHQIILFVGSLTHTHSYKGVDYLLRALRYIKPAFPDANIVVVGDGPLRPYLQAIANRQGAGDRVHFVGQVSRDELRAYYAAASVSVLPSITRAEGFGLVLLEAMACGRPVVGSSVGGIPYFLRHRENGILVPPKDPEAIAEAVIEILSDQALAKELGRRGRALVEEVYCLRAMVDRTLELYSQLAS